MSSDTSRSFCFLVFSTSKKVPGSIPSLTISLYDIRLACSPRVGVSFPSGAPVSISNVYKVVHPILGVDFGPGSGVFVGLR